MWSQVLTPTLGAIGHTCLVLDNWAKPPALAHAWCLLETLASLTAGSKLSVQVGMSWAWHVYVCAQLPCLPCSHLDTKFGPLLLNYLYVLHWSRWA